MLFCMFPSRFKKIMSCNSKLTFIKSFNAGEGWKCAEDQTALKKCMKTTSVFRLCY